MICMDVDPTSISARLLLQLTGEKQISKAKVKKLGFSN